jgi:hypothetical protein
MFRALLAHLQEALHKQQLVFCVRVIPTLRARKITIFDCAEPSEDEQVMLETCRGS